MKYSLSLFLCIALHTHKQDPFIAERKIFKCDISCIGEILHLRDIMHIYCILHSRDVLHCRDIMHVVRKLIFFDHLLTTGGPAIISNENRMGKGVQSIHFCHKFAFPLSKTHIHSWIQIYLFFILEVFLWIVLISKRLEPQMPDWSQIEENLISFNLGPIWHL